MDDLIALDYIARHLRRERVFRDRYNPIESLSECEFIELYRIRKETALHLIQLGICTARETQRNQSISPIVQLCSTLNILATGTTIRKTSELLGISKSATHYIFWQTIENLLSHASTFISFPKDPVTLSQEFFQLGNIPNIVGCVDGTLIEIKRPLYNEHIYVSRKGLHSLNVLIVNRADLTISYINARFPGSAHDSFVYQMSSISEIFNQPIFKRSLLLGDSGFPLTENLMVPFLTPSNVLEGRYNRIHKIMRSSVERTLGVWKARWRIVDKQSGAIRCNPTDASKIIVATAILHNICIRQRIPLPDLNVDEEDNEFCNEEIGGKEVRLKILHQLAN